MSKLILHDLEAARKRMTKSRISLDEISNIDSQTLRESGPVQELARNFNLLSLAGTGILAGNVWPALGGSILVAIPNGGPPGVLYEFIAASCFYFIVAASLAELASAMPSSAGPYLWASVTPGKKYGRAIGFFAGWWNVLAWIFAAASMSAICGALHYHDLLYKRWMIVDLPTQRMWSCRCTLSPIRRCRSGAGTSSLPTCSSRGAAVQLSASSTNSCRC